VTGPSLAAEKKPRTKSSSGGSQAHMKARFRMFFVYVFPERKSFIFKVIYSVLDRACSKKTPSVMMILRIKTDESQGKMSL
jgi:hypothetical protein